LIALGDVGLIVASARVNFATDDETTRWTACAYSACKVQPDH
jgi:hypothetical protein